MSALIVLAWMAAAIGGALAHELAHYAVWVVSGRAPDFDVWQLEVVPTAGSRESTETDRIAAAAPYAVGAVAVAYGVASTSVTWAVFGLAMVQLPSRADLAAMRGDVEWATLG